MKRKLFVSLVCILGVFAASAQTNFENLTLEEALNKAGQQDKLVFVDCYTVWCGPCKFMADNIFTLDDVATFTNERFISVKYDMEKGDGPAIAGKYAVDAFPTFLILNPDGSLLHTVVGASPTGEEFIVKLKQGLGKDELKSRYAAGDRDNAFLAEYIATLLNGGETELARSVAGEMLNLAGEQDIYTEPYWFIFENTDLTLFGSANMMFLLTYAADFRESLGAERVDARIYELFETSLEDIIRGRNRNASPEYVDKVEELIVAQDMKNKQMLFDYIALIRATRAGETGTTLELLEKIFPALDESKTAYLYYNPVLSLRSKWTPKQLKALISLTRELAGQAKSEANSSSLLRFVDAIEKF